jgi:hypothetical protein
VFHNNLLRSGVTVADPADADIFLVPLYARLGLYAGEQLQRMQNEALQLLKSSAYLKASGGRDHIVVWTSQREPTRLLGKDLAYFLRFQTAARFLTVEAGDARPMHLRLTPGRDILVPPYVPGTQVLANPTSALRRPLLAVFSGSVAHADVRQRLLRAISGDPEVSVVQSTLKLLQDADPNSDHAREAAEVVRHTLAEMSRAKYVPP